MAIAIGAQTLNNITLPAAIDTGELTRLTLRDGATIAEILQDINDGFTEKQNDVDSNVLIRSLTSATEEVTVEYRQGATNGFEDHTEFADPDEQTSDTSGHMLPIKKQDRKLGWTRDFLEECRRSRIDDDIAEATEDYEEAIEKRVLTRAFSSAAISGKANGLGSTGKSVPYCDGGACGVDFTPPRGRDGKRFDNTHTHYLRMATISHANLETAAEHLWEHKHDAPFVLLVSQLDVNSWTAVVNSDNEKQFVPRGVAGVVYGANDALANVDNVYHGIIKTKFGPVYLLSSGRIPTGYARIYKEYSRGDLRQSVAWRIDPMYGQAPHLDVPAARSLPIEGAIVLYKGGFGVGKDRTNGVQIRFAGSGSYTDPTIS